ncbi:MAG: 3-keto-disaccharide hydrolase, partial [Limisphaerales bacterium]
MKTYCFPIVVAAAILAGCASNAADSAASKPKTGQIGHVDSEGFTLISDGSWTGWKVNENPASWSLADGGFKAQGERSHNFYTGPLAPFKDFELKVDVKTAPNSNGGIYIHTKYQDSGWPWGGYETQVNQTQGDWRKSGSIYSVQDVKADKLEGVVRDNEWYTHHVIVK